MIRNPLNFHDPCITSHLAPNPCFTFPKDECLMSDQSVRQSDRGHSCWCIPLKQELEKMKHITEVYIEVWRVFEPFINNWRFQDHQFKQLYVSTTCWEVKPLYSVQCTMQMLSDHGLRNCCPG